MAEPDALAAALRDGEHSVHTVLSRLVEEQHPNAAHFGAYTKELLEFLDASTDPELRTLAVAALCALIERTAFSSPEPLSQAAPYVLPPIVHALAATPRIEKLPAALETLWLASRLETEQALRQWGLVSNDPAVRLAALGQLETWVSGLNGRFAFRKFTPLVVSLLRDSSQPVRDASYTLIVKFFASSSPRAREDLDGIMRKQQIPDALRAKIASAISRELHAASQSPGLPHSRPQSRSSSASPLVPRTPTPQKRGPESPSSTRPFSAGASAAGSESRPGSSREVLDLELSVVHETAYPMQALAPVNIFSEDEFLNEISSRLACFEGKESESNWSHRQDAVQRFRQMLRCTYVTLSPPTLRSAMRLLHKPFSDTLLSLRTTLVGFTCQAIKDVVQLVPKNMVAELTDPLLEPLSQVASGIKKITATAAHICLCAIMIESETVSARQFQMIKTASQSKKPHARTYAVYWLRAGLVTAQQPSPKLEDRVADVEHLAVNAITDAVHTTREEGRQLYWVLQQVWPALASKVLSTLPATAVKTLQASRPKVKQQAASAMPAPIRSPEPGTLSSSEAEVPLTQLAAASRPPTGLGITNDAEPPRTPVPSDRRSGGRHPSSSAGRAVGTTPAMRTHSTEVSQSLADLSLHEPDGANVDLENPNAIRASVKEIGALTVLRKLATSNCSPATTSMVLKTIREEAPGVSSAADIAKLVQTDLSGASMTQRLGYLQLLEQLNYEQDTVESVRPATSPAPSSIRTVRSRTSRLPLYVDSESSGSEASPHSTLSRSSLASQSSLSSVDDSKAAMHNAVRSAHEPGEVEGHSSWTIATFPSTEPACKTYIDGLVQQVENHTAKPEVLAALSLLITSSASPPARNSPLFTAVDVWRRSYTFDMHLRDVILVYLNQCADTQSLLSGLIVLRALLVTPTQTPATAYLEPLACIRCLLQVVQTHGGQSLEIDEHALPAARDAVMQGGRTFGSRSLLELLASAYEQAPTSLARAFILETLNQAVSYTGLLVDEGAGVLPLVMKALDDGDALVRKEAYPVLVTIQRQNELLGTHAQTRMQAGQRRLLQHYLHIS